jgi:predicted Zn-dependent protease
MTEDEQPRTLRVVVYCAVALAVVAGLWLAKPAYRAWKKQRHLAQAEAFLAKDDLKNAALSARQVLVLDPANVEASVIMARLTQQLRSPETVAWWQRVVDLDAANPTNLVSLAEAALMFGQFQRAEQILVRVSTNARNTVAFHQAAAMTLASQRRLAEAEAHFAAGLKLEPTNELLRINRAVILLQTTDTNLVQQGLATLEQAATNAAHRRIALQNLNQAHLHMGRHDEAIAAARQLAEATNATFADRMTLLATLHQARATNFSAKLTALQSRAVQDGAEAVQALSSWLMATGQTDAAIRWLDTLPKELKSQQRVALVRADLHLTRGEWPQLQAVLESGQWNEAEFLRHALLARALREQRQTMSATAEWLAATRAVVGQPKQISILARMAGAWKWTDEERDLLWILTERHPGERWASARLNEIFFGAGDTRSLNRLYNTLYSQTPENLVLKNNLAVTTLLLTPQSVRGSELARELHQQNPTNAVFASTHAFSLHLRGQRDEALKVFAAVSPDSLKQPSIALYHGLVLGTNSPAEAARYLDLAGNASLLPEERALLEELRRALPQ